MTPKSKVVIMKLALHREATLLCGSGKLDAADGVLSFVRSCGDTSLERLFDIVSASSKPLGGLNPAPGNEA